MALSPGGWLKLGQVIITYVGAQDSAGLGDIQQAADEHIADNWTNATRQQLSSMQMAAKMANRYPR